MSRLSSGRNVSESRDNEDEGKKSEKVSQERKLYFAILFH